MNCKRTAHEWTELNEGNLSLFRRAGLRLHMAVCPPCRRYAKQMSATVRTLGEAQPPMPEAKSQAIAEKILRARKKS